MKNTILLLLLFLVTSCVLDRIPRVKIEIDQRAISKIDTLEVIRNSHYNGEIKDSKKVLKNTKEYYFSNEEDFGTIRLKLIDKTEIKLDSIQLRNTDRLIVSELNGSYKIKPKSDSKILAILKFLLISLLTLFLSKIAPALFILKPNSRKDFILKYGLFSMIFILGSFLTFGLVAGKGIILMFIGLIAILFVDFLFLYYYCEKREKIKPIIAVIVGNLLFWIGAYLFMLMTFLL